MLVVVVEERSHRSVPLRPDQLVVPPLPVEEPTRVSSRVLATVVVICGAIAVTLDVLFAWPLTASIGFAWLATSVYAAIPPEDLTLALRLNVYDVVGSLAAKRQKISWVMIAVVVTRRSIEFQAPPPLGCAVMLVIVVLPRRVSWATRRSPLTTPAGIGITSEVAAPPAVVTPTLLSAMAGSIT